MKDLKSGRQRPDWYAASPGIQRDQRVADDERRHRCRVAYSELMGWSLYRHKDVMGVLLDHETFSSAVSPHLSAPRGMNQPEHTAYRRIIEPCFSAIRMEAFEPNRREIATRLVQGVGANQEAEFMADAALPFALQVQCAFHGWPRALQEPLVRRTRKSHEATLAQERQAMSEIALEFEGIRAFAGTPLTRLEMRVFLEKLMAGIGGIATVAEKAPTLAVFAASGFAVLPLRLFVG